MPCLIPVVLVSLILHHDTIKVLDQFLQTSIDESADLTESYLIGNRLVKFLSTVLPTHPQYFSDDQRLVEMRSRSQGQLVQLLQYLEQLARIIDEEELNKYILKDLKQPGGSDPNPNTDCNTNTATNSSMNTKNNNGRENIAESTGNKDGKLTLKLAPSDKVAEPFDSPPKTPKRKESNVPFSVRSTAVPEEEEIRFALSSSPISNRSPHVLELDSTLSSAESPPHSNNGSPAADSNTTIETTLSFKLAQGSSNSAKVIDNPLFGPSGDANGRSLQNEEASAWEDRFSQYHAEPGARSSSPSGGTSRARSTQDMARRLPPPIHENEQDEGKDVSFSEIVQDAQKFDHHEDLFAMRDHHERRLGSPLASPSQAARPEEKSTEAKRAVTNLGSEWEPATALGFSLNPSRPDGSKPEQRGRNQPQYQRSRMMMFSGRQGSKVYAPPVDETSTRMKQEESLIATGELLQSASTDSDSSPKSVLELRDWKTADNMNKHQQDEMATLFQELSRPKAFDESSLATNEAEEVSFITGSGGKLTRRNRLRHFKGCVKCLLE